MWMVSVAPAITHKDDEQIVVASIGMRRKQESFHNAIRDAVRRLGAVLCWGGKRGRE